MNKFQKEIFETGKELINLMSVKENEDNWEKREKCLQKIKNLCDKESSNDIQEYGQLNFIIPSILESVRISSFNFFYLFYISRFIVYELLYRLLR